MCFLSLLLAMVTVAVTHCKGIYNFFPLEALFDL